VRLLRRGDHCCVNSCVWGNLLEELPGKCGWGDLRDEGVGGWGYLGQGLRARGLPTMVV
jgi:hypothetical protein